MGVSDNGQAVGDATAWPRTWPRPTSIPTSAGHPKMAKPEALKVTPQSNPQPASQTPQVKLKEAPPPDIYAGLSAQTILEMKAGAAALKR